MLCSVNLDPTEFEMLRSVKLDPTEFEILRSVNLNPTGFEMLRSAKLDPSRFETLRSVRQDCIVLPGEPEIWWNMEKTLSWSNIRTIGAANILIQRKGEKM